MMEQLQASRMEDFINRAVTFVANEYPHIAARAEDAKIAELVRFAVDRARRYGFMSEREFNWLAPAQPVTNNGIPYKYDVRNGK
jgi:hypothetical protein